MISLSSNVCTRVSWQEVYNWKQHHEDVLHLFRLWGGKKPLGNKPYKKFHITEEKKIIKNRPEISSTWTKADTADHHYSAMAHHLFFIMKGNSLVELLWQSGLLQLCRTCVDGAKTKRIYQTSPISMWAEYIMSYWPMTESSHFLYALAKRPCSGFLQLLRIHEMNVCSEGRVGQGGPRFNLLLSCV